jgi:hypothetical protein
MEASRPMVRLAKKVVATAWLSAWAIAFSLIVAGCSKHRHVSGQSGAQTAILKSTLSKLNLKNPAADAKALVATGDRRPVGVYGYSCHVPGPEGRNLPPSVDIRCLDGTGDVSESEEHHHLIEIATAYAEAYDQELKREGLL